MTGQRAPETPEAFARWSLGQLVRQLAEHVTVMALDGVPDDSARRVADTMIDVNLWPRHLGELDRSLGSPYGPWLPPAGRAGRRRLARAWFRAGGRLG